MSSTHRKRLRAAFIIAPLVPTLYFAYMIYFAGSDNSGSTLKSMVILFTLILSYLACLVIGRGAIRFLNRRNMLTLPFVVLVGCCGGILVWYFFGYLIGFILSSERSLIPSIVDILWGAVLGVSIALPFAIIAGFPIKNR